MTQLSRERNRAAGLVLAVRLGADVLAIPIGTVEEVLPALPIESLPSCPDFIRGVVFVRGHLIPVVDAAERLGLKGHERPLEPHIVCLRVAGRFIGVEFDEALDLMDLSTADVIDTEEIGARGGFFCGVVEWEGQVIRLLDPDQLIESSEAEDLEQVPRTSERSS